MTIRAYIAIAVTCLLSGFSASAVDFSARQIVPREIQSKNFANSKIAVNPLRKLAIYLPPGYAESANRYPVIYFFASPFDSSFRAIFDQMGAQGTFDRAIAAGTIHKFIFAAVDMTTPLGCSWYVNSSATRELGGFHRARIGALYGHELSHAYDA